MTKYVWSSAVLVRHKSKTNVKQNHATLRHQTDAATDARRRITVCVTDVEPTSERMVPNDCLRLTAENERAAEV